MTTGTNADDPLSTPSTDEVLATLAEALKDLDSVVRSFEHADAKLASICARVVTAVPGADAAGVTVLRDGTAVTAASTEAFVLAIDAAQYEQQEGPCVDAAVTRDIVRADRAQAAERWPSFARAIERVDVTSFLSAPITAGEDYVGALNLYGHHGHDFDTVDEQALRVYVRAAQSVLSADERAQQAARRVEGYAAAMESRAAIEQAKGALMIALGVTADKAFDLLLWRSQTTNVKVRDLAEQFVDDLATLDAAPGAFADELGKVLMTVHRRVLGQ
ncbi:GAF and ANTAR domain-containing protein [Rhodococcus kroppenstedtii]|uniref:GAF and ANTAR domain-containing protein n=1 Tax=Rhodococcoides kroppenstedtii TaxID=293050 RepID=UPI002955B8C0|nr:GAF and ANTAR domain-containing protein [Rhodococcus kroppenstedtii]MDV7198292.1 GAF and ANTAR domain-containing protein [Rhodococcus kroppenstedtii]